MILRIAIFACSRDPPAPSENITVMLEDGTTHSYDQKSILNHVLHTEYSRQEIGGWAYKFKPGNQPGTIEGFKKGAIDWRLTHGALISLLLNNSLGHNNTGYVTYNVTSVPLNSSINNTLQQQGFLRTGNSSTGNSSTGNSSTGLNSTILVNGTVSERICAFEWDLYSKPVNGSKFQTFWKFGVKDYPVARCNLIKLFNSANASSSPNKTKIGLCFRQNATNTFFDNQTYGEYAELGAVYQANDTFKCNSTKDKLINVTKQNASLLIDYNNLNVLTRNAAETFGPATHPLTTNNLRVSNATCGQILNGEF